MVAAALVALLLLLGLFNNFARHNSWRPAERNEVLELLKAPDTIRVIQDKMIVYNLIEYVNKRCCAIDIDQCSVLQTIHRFVGMDVFYGKRLFFDCSLRYVIDNCHRLSHVYRSACHQISNSNVNINLPPLAVDSPVFEIWSLMSNLLSRILMVDCGVSGIER